METITIWIDKESIGLESAWGISWLLAKLYNPNTTLKAWFDKKRARYSPTLHECAAKGVPDWENFGQLHGGKKKFVIGQEDYVFIFT